MITLLVIVATAGAAWYLGRAYQVGQDAEYAGQAEREAREAAYARHPATLAQAAQQAPDDDGPVLPPDVVRALHDEARAILTNP